ncbi:conjugal transfer protein TrbE [Acetobacteraceae bacterium]|nr:conjugal transfer protein TrbE [Acetobacteraceae bacterium]
MLFFLLITCPIDLLIIFSILFVCYAQLVKQAGNHIKLNQFRTTETAFPDKLLYQELIEDDTLLCKDGSLLAVFAYRGKDIDSSTASERNYLSEITNRALAQLGDGWTLHVDASRVQVPNYFPKDASHFNDPLTEAIDEERRALFEGKGALFNTGFTFSLGFLPPALLTKKYTDLFVDKDEVDATPEKHAQENLQKFKEGLEKFKEALSSSLKLERLGSYVVPQKDGSEVKFSRLLEYLRYCITGVNDRVRFPADPSFIDYLIGSQEMIPGKVPHIAGKYTQFVAIEGFPESSTPGILNVLTQLPIECRFSSRCIMLAEHDAIGVYDKQRKKWRQKIYGMRAQFLNDHSNPDLDAQKMEADAIAALAETRSQEVSQAFFTSGVILRHENKKQLGEYSKQVAARINQLGFLARIETFNTLDAFFGALPGDAIANVRRPIVNTRNIGDMLPTNAIWSGSPVAPCDKFPPNSPALMQCVTQGAEVFYCNNHRGDVGHMLILGPTGAGKSTLLAIMEAQARRYEGATLFAFDKGMSMYPLCAAINAATQGKSGQHYEVGSDESTLSFAPLQFLETKSDQAWAIGWIKDILNLNKIDPTPQQMKSIAEAIQKMANIKGETSLSAFENLVADTTIRDVLAPYIIGGSHSHLLSADTDTLAFADFNVFEIEELMELSEEFRMPVLLYLFRRIEKALKGQPAYIILDEAWIMLGNPVFREKIREWLKVLRKANCSVILATQSLSDADRSGILDVLIESCQTKIFLPNPSAVHDTKTYRKFGLNDRQIEIISQGIQKREYYFFSEEGQRLFELALGEFALSFVACSDKISISRIKKLQKEHGYDWVEHWLDERNVLWPANTPKIPQKEIAL